MPQIPSYTEKTVLADDDLFVIADSASSNATKKLKFKNLADFSAISGALTVGGTGIVTDVITERVGGDNLILALIDSNTGALLIQNAGASKQVAEFIPDTLHVHLGDVVGAGNATRFEIVDATNTINFSSVIHLKLGLASYVDDAAAISGGLVTGDCYKVTGTGVVHQVL